MNDLKLKNIVECHLLLNVGLCYRLVFDDSLLFKLGILFVILRK